MSLDLTVREARDQMRAQLMAGEAVKCPCCTQLAKIYKRRIHAGMARSLILMFRRGGTDWIHVPTTVPERARDDGMLAYWGLTEEELVRREDGGRAGWWRVTDRGAAFVNGHITLPKYAHVYDGRVLRVDGDAVSIRDALGTKFNYEELMSQ